jgi:hypothetical protein
MFSVWTVGMALDALFLSRRVVAGAPRAPVCWRRLFRVYLAGALSALVGIIGLAALTRLKRTVPATETA